MESVRQPDLFAPEYDIVHPNYEDRMSNAEKFALFHSHNPWVLMLLKRILRDKADAGYRRYGIAAAYEELRWRGTVRTDGKPYKLNNTYRAYYARLIRDTDPRLGQLLQTREQQED